MMSKYVPIYRLHFITATICTNTEIRCAVVRCTMCGWGGRRVVNNVQLYINCSSKTIAPSTSTQDASKFTVVGNRYYYNTFKTCMGDEISHEMYPHTDCIKVVHCTRTSICTYRTCTHTLHITRHHLYCSNPPHLLSPHPHSTNY